MNGNPQAQVGQVGARMLGQPALAQRARWARALAALALAGALTACGGGGGGESNASNSANDGSEAAMSEAAQLGQLIFRDTSLSASGRQACISCHDPEHGHAAPNALAAQLGGADGSLQGGRSSPSIRYLATNRAFALAADGSPSGGFFWDGRAATLQAQAGGPFLNPVEMANASTADMVAKLARSAYAARFAALYGADIFSRPDDAFARATLALQQYQLEDSEFRPFSSQYDAFLRGQASLSTQQLRGLALFNAPDKGNCAACHPSAKGADGSFPLFTDFSYDNLGVPRNSALAANADPAHFDLGLCGRNELASRSDLCGAFKVPSLRNVALRGAFFHNGRFATLKDALSFYVTRDTQPERWYPLRADGTVAKFDDLPAVYHGNVNTSEAPYNRRPGDSTALSDAEIDDVIAFLATLTDGWSR